MPSDEPELRIGGWVPAHREKPGLSPVESEDDGPDRLVVTPVDGREAAGRVGQRRLLFLITGLVAGAVLLTAGGVAAAVHRGSPPPASTALVTEPAASSPAAAPVPAPDPSPTVSASPAGGADAKRTARARPTTPSASPSSSKATTVNPLAAGTAVSLEPTDLPGSLLRHFNGLAEVDPISAASSDTDKADARWIVHAGLADSACVSFESSNFPGEFLRHQDSRLRRDPPDGSDLFKSDATFCPETVGSPTVVRFRSSNYPARYLARQGTDMFLAAEGTAGETFTVRSPL